MSRPGGEPPRSLWRHPPLVLFWFARILSSGAFQMQAVAIGWQLYMLTGNALDLGLVGLAQFVPMLVLTLAVGQVADRYDRRVIAAVCQVITGGAAAILALGSAGGWLGREAIFAVVAVAGAARAFESPTMAALVPALVPSRLIMRATAWSTSANQVAQIGGPALGGLLVVLGPTAAYAACVASFLLAAALVTRIRIERKVRKREPVSLETLFAGFLFVWRKPVVLGSLSLDLFAVLAGSATALLPIYARDILATGPWGLGLLRAAPAVGAIVMTVALAHRPLERHIGATLFASVGAFGLATFAFGLSTSLPLSLAALVVLGAADVVSVVIRFALVQIETPDDMRGRVSAINSLFVGTSNQLGEFRAGLAAALIGAVPAVAIGGVGTILVALAWTRLFPSLRRIQSLTG